MSEENNGMNKEEACQGNCGSCTENCASRKTNKEDFLVPANPFSKIKRVIGVVSGKGGVGKSFITSYMAVNMQKKGYQTAILDADITGPSIPRSFGISEKCKGTELGLFPSFSKNGTKVMSLNLLLDEEEIPVVWRGPVIANTVKQFWSEVIWDKVDYMFVDMPPGTGDVPLTVFQSLPLDGIIIVTSPQELVSMIVGKAVNMAKAMGIPILGIVENYSYISCDSCGEKIRVFGESHVDEVAKKYGLKVLAQIPIDTQIAKAIDKGMVEDLEGDWLNEAVAFVEQVCPIEETEERKFKIAVTTDQEKNVYGHFGGCEKFTIYEVKNGKIDNSATIENKGKGHSAVVECIKEAQADVVICGGIGEAAMNELLQANIGVIPGQSGNVEEVVKAFLTGSLMTSQTATCSHSDSDKEEGCGCGCNCGCH